jgi:hypothetical protein
MEELVIVAQTMVGEELRDEEAQSLWDYVEEVAKPTPQKSNLKKIWKDEASLSKAKSHERTHLVKHSKGEDKMSTGSLAKTPTTPNKHKGNEPIVELAWHVDFHSFYESSGDVHSLIFP